MDARPQRPLRSMRTFNDENVNPDGPLPKTIHHRNKSSPALSNAANGAALKIAAKRTAFGDVSNIVGIQRTIGKEDGLSSSKTVLNTGNKSQLTVQEKKPAAFLRPAQRPLSVSNLKNLLTGSASNAIPTEDQPKSHLSDIPSLPAANSRKALTRKTTSIFKDVSLETVQEQVVADPRKKPQPEALVVNGALHTVEVELPTPDSHLYLAPPNIIPINEPAKESIQTTKDSGAIEQDNRASEPQTATNVVLKKDDAPPPTITEHDYSLPPSIAAYILAQATDSMPSIEDVLPSGDSNKEEAKPLPPIHHISTVEPLASLDNQVAIPPRPEPEEYWEDYEEYGYEEDAYVTARSSRSKGDNTTGGVTTVLVPSTNPNVRREIEAATKLVESTRTIEEMEDEAYDTSMVAEYGDEIFEYMRHLEAKMTPNPHYMDSQHEIQWSMRSVLMDWLVQVHHRFNLLPETLFLCVNFIDRFLSCKVVSLGKLQLVGATAIFIAAKYEEINCPSVQEIVYMVDGGYSIDEILKAERFMLTMLQFELGWPGPMSFLRRISKADDYDLETRTLAKYFLEVTLMDERFIGSPPSFTAAASHCLARMMLRKGSWTQHHVYYSGYTFTQLKPLVQLVLECCEDPRKHHKAVYDKYCDKRYKRASIFVENEMTRGFYLPQSPVNHHPVPPSMYGYYNKHLYFGL